MSGKEALLNFSLRKWDDDLAFVQDALHSVLEDLGEHALAEHVPWRSGNGGNISTALPLPLTPRAVQMFSIAFQLLNMVEENTANQGRRRAESERGTASLPGLYAELFKQLRAHGVSEDEIARLLSSVAVQPVLTAHPTEAKRQTVLEHHRRLYLLLLSRENQMFTPGEREGFAEKFRAQLELLWRTGELYRKKPDVELEVRSIFHYLRHVFPEVVGLLDERFRRAWLGAGLSEARLNTPSVFPRLSFGSWVGADQDGHPLVTAEVTRHTFDFLRQGALDLYDERLRELARYLSLSDELQPVPLELLEKLAAYAEQVPATARGLADRNPGEPWRQFVGLIRAKLPLARAGTSSTIEPGPIPHYRTPDELRDDLLLLHSALEGSSGALEGSSGALEGSFGALEGSSGALEGAGGHKISVAYLLPLIRLLDVFGFHLASLDVRQNSRFFEEAIDELLAAAGVSTMKYSELSEEKRLEFLDSELALLRPFAHSDVPLGPHAERLRETFRVLRTELTTRGPRGIGTVIVSMTRSLSDLLVVYLLAREAGLVIPGEGGPVSEIAVTPLFETIDDLERAAGITSAFLHHPFVGRSLRYHCEREGRAQPHLEVMIGYSDSSKDGGILASQCALYRTQDRVSALGRTLGVEVHFFHGRGGTVSRGAGPTNLFLRSLPAKSLSGRIRITEQGETISQKYANTLTAAYNLELLTAGVAHATHLLQTKEGPPAGGLELLERIAAKSTAIYRSLLEQPGFMEFYSQATPIDVLEESRIGSRPTRRSGRRTLQDLRAIPWVFSWSQAAFYLPGWYSVGGALKAFREESPEDYDRFHGFATGWPFLSYILNNIETSLQSAYPDVMSEYSELVESAEIRAALFSKIEEEYLTAKEELARLLGGYFVHRRPRLTKTLDLRRGPLVALHRSQIALLKEWRQARKDHHAEKAELLLEQLLLTVNAIASGQRTTG